MAISSKIKLLGNLLLVFIFIFSTFAAVEVFSEYKTTLTINNDNTVLLNKTLKLKNVYDVGIVPGQIEFKVGRGIDGSIDNLEVKDVVAIDRFGNVIKSQLRNTNDYSIIILDVYYPLLPGFEYEFNLVYTLAYKPGGIFFKVYRFLLEKVLFLLKKENLM